jgi:hypothetical protein
MFCYSKFNFISKKTNFGPRPHYLNEIGSPLYKNSGPIPLLKKRFFARLDNVLLHIDQPPQLQTKEAYQ